MSETGDTIDWKAELRKYEREFLGLPPERTREQERAERLAALAQQEQLARTGDAFAGWMRLMLVVALAGCLPLWPYARDCGVGLDFYLTAELAVAIGGMWVAAYAWSRRLGRTHALALAMALWGMTLLASEVLPRVGYARTSATNPPRWSCRG